MIIEAILNVFLIVFTTLFGWFPNFPAMPGLIVDGWAWFTSVTNSAIGVLAYFLSEPLYYMAIGLIIFMTTFQYIYHFFIRFIILRIAMGFIKH